MNNSNTDWEDYIDQQYLSLLHQMESKGEGGDLSLDMPCFYSRCSSNSSTLKVMFSNPRLLWKMLC